MMVKSAITSAILKLHDLAIIQGQKLIFSNIVLGIVVKRMLWNNLSYQAKRTQLLSEFNSKFLALCLWLDLSDFLICMRINILNFIVIIFYKNADEHT